MLPLLLLLLWQAAALRAAEPSLLPGPQRVWAAFLELWRAGRFWPDFLTSLGRVGLGFFLAALAGVPLGYLLGRACRFAIWTRDTLDFLRQVPPVALVPLLLLWLGLGEAPKLLVIFYAACFPILLGAELGARQVEPRLLEVAHLYRHSTGSVWRQVVIPSALPATLAGLRLGLGYGWRSLVVAEMLAAAKGLGALIVQARAFGRVDQMFVGVFAIGLAGLLLDRLVGLLVRLLPVSAAGGDAA